MAHGPVSEEEAKRLIEEGTIRPDTLVWKNGLNEWVRADGTSLGILFHRTPPPLPNNKNPTMQETGDANFENRVQYFDNSGAPTVTNNILKISLILFAISSLILFARMVRGLSILTDAESGNYSQDAINRDWMGFLEGANSIYTFNFVGYLATFILFLVWHYRACKNLERNEVQNLKYGAIWSVAYYFIPILFFFRPYQAMGELWRASHSRNHQNIGNPGKLIIWWLAFIIINVPIPAHELIFQGKNNTDIKAGLIINMIYSICSIIAVWMIYLISSEITKAQAQGKFRASFPPQDFGGGSPEPTVRGTATPPEPRHDPESYVTRGGRPMQRR